MRPGGGGGAKSGNKLHSQDNFENTDCKLKAFTVHFWHFGLLKEGPCNHFNPPLGSTPNNSCDN